MKKSRSRVYRPLGGTSVTTRVQSGTSPQVTTVTSDLSGRQNTVSEGHPFPAPSGALSDVGGDFFTTKSYVESKGKHLRQNKAISGAVFGRFAQSDTFRGMILPYLPVTGGKLQFPPSIHSGYATLDKMGATAVARCRPDSPIASASTFLGELLHEGLPHGVGSQVWADRTLKAKTIGDEYLNVQFGWSPMIQDIKSMTSVLVHANSVLAQYERDAGKVVRRRYNFPPEHTRTETDLGNGYYPVGPNSSIMFESGGRLVLKVETFKKTWFSGAFTYYLPSGYDSRNKMDRAALLANRIGLDMSPDTIWNLTPWSWAVDWFSNAGDVLSNINSFAIDGNVMRYGYIMEHTMVKHTYSLAGAKWRGNYPSGNYLPGSDCYVPALTLVTETKQRRRAHPYGFGFTWDGLSSFQASILAALGISRSGR